MLQKIVHAISMIVYVCLLETDCCVYQKMAVSSKLFTKIKTSRKPQSYSRSLLVASFQNGFEGKDKISVQIGHDLHHGAIHEVNEKLLN